MYSGGGYNFGNYDSRTGKEPSSVVGKQSVGNTSLKYLYADEDEDEDEENNNDENEEIENVTGIARKVVTSLPMQASDPYSFKNADKAAGQTKNTGGLNLVFEFAGNHTNPIRKGISPYPQSKHSGGTFAGGAEQIYRTTGNFKRTGTHRPHGHMAVQDEDNIFNLSSFLDEEQDPDIKNFKKQQNRVKKVLMSINE